MKKKQVLGIVIAAVIIIATGVVGVFSAERANSIKINIGDIVEFPQSSMNTEPLEASIAVIDIAGSIQGGGGGYGHDFVVDNIRSAAESDSNRGILLRINSPGGTVYHSDETYLELLDYKEKTGRPVWAYCSEQAASGAYYIASAADKIFSNRNGTVGSIGVYIQLTDASELMDKLGVSVNFVRSSDNKAMGNMYNSMTEEQVSIFQAEVDECYEQFLSVVCEGRGFTEEQLRPIADGRSYTARQALDNGLIDGISRYEETEAEFMELCGVESVYNPVNIVANVYDYFIGLAESLPRGENETLVELAKNSESGVAMYYAG